jgi:adenosylcobinamide-GDP ribazoletransferase
MEKSDTTLIKARDIPAALGLLTRFPIVMDFETAQARSAQAPWAYPIVGAILGVLAVCFGMVLQITGIDDRLIAGLILAFLTITTGAMHEDGLADSLDGLWGGWEKTRRLEIMKDSSIGAYGVIGLILSMGMRWAGLFMLLSHDMLWGLIAIAALSRAAMVPMMHALPLARAGGLSYDVGRPSVYTASIAILLASAIACLTLGLTAIIVLIATFIATAIWGMIAYRKIGGQTGDILGVTQQIAEITALIVLTACINSAV